MPGQTLPQATRDAVSGALAGKKRTPAACAAISPGKMGKKRGPYKPRVKALVKGQSTLTFVKV